MKAIAVFPDKKEVQLIDHPEPKLGSTSQVKLKMIDVGICGLPEPRFSRFTI